MESAWQQLQDRLASDGPEFTYDEVRGWNAEEFDAFTKSGLIAEIALATLVACDACPVGHWERVLWSEDGKRAYISCPEAGIVDVDLDRLRRWKCCPQQVAHGISKALTHCEVQPIPTIRLWFLGRRRTAGHTPYFFFAAVGPDKLESTIKAVREAYGRVTGMLFVPFPSPASTEGKLRVVDVGKAASLEDGQMMVDLEFIDEQFGDGRTLRLSAKDASEPLMAHRRAILRTYGEDKSMQALGSQLRIEVSILHAMARGDTRKYGETRLIAMLQKIGCSRANWDRVPKLAKRK